MLAALIGIAMVAISLYMNYANIVLFDPLYSFAVQQSLSMLGTAIVTKTILHRKKRRRSR